VIVFLGDLGRDLPESERAYWRSFNIAPDGPPLSTTAFTRSIRGWFADPARTDLAFTRTGEVASHGRYSRLFFLCIHSINCDTHGLALRS
jgi:hypothetical protein